MKFSKEVLTKAGMYPKLQLGIKGDRGVRATGPHTVKLLEDKIIKKLNVDGVEDHYIRYVVEENGEKLQYDARMKAKVGNDVNYLVQALAGIPEGEEVILEMKKAGVKNYIAVTRVSTGETVKAVEDEDDETPEEESEEGREEPTIAL